jgi:membrane protease YdiL (CAAX protease family)
MKINIKEAVNWKTFFILFIAGMISSILVLPYIFSLSPETAKIFTPVVLFAQMMQAGIEFAIAIFVGLYLAKKVGFKLPVLEGQLPLKHLRSVLGISVALGIIAGILIVLFSFLFLPLSVSLLEKEISVPWWQSLLASFYGGIGEEIFFRLFLMTLLTWIFTKINKRQDNIPAKTDIWLAIIISALLFGLGHLPITGALTEITYSVVLRAIILNGIGSLIFSWLYWKKGLESAMIAHFSGDIVLHVIVPLAGSLLL